MRSHSGADTITIRQARDDDRGFIDELGAETALTTISPIRPVSKDGAVRAYRRMAQFCRRREGTVVLVAERRSERAGFLMLITDIPDDVTQSDQGFVAYVAVAEGQRGQGVGRALIQAAVTECKRRDLPHLSLMVSSDNRSARSLYQDEAFLEERILMTRAL